MEENEIKKIKEQYSVDSPKIIKMIVKHDKYYQKWLENQKKGESKNESRSNS